MIDREKVIKDLEAWINEPYARDTAIEPILVHDALALLKEQDEEVEPKRMYHAERASFDNYLCECKAELYYRQRYCDVCGRSVKWE